LDNMKRVEGITLDKTIKEEQVIKDDSDWGFHAEADKMMFVPIVYGSQEFVLKNLLERYDEKVLEYNRYRFGPDVDWAATLKSKSVQFNEPARTVLWAGNPNNKAMEFWIEEEAAERRKNS
jgi:hypothetical protein